MPRLSNFEKTKNQALDLLKTIKVDKKERNRYETTIYSAQRIDKVQRIIDELNALKAGINTQVFRQEQQTSVIEKRLKKIQEAQINDNLSKHTLKFTFNNVSDNIYLHSKEVKDMFRNHPNAIVDNGIVYIDTDNKPIQGTVTIDIEDEQVQFNNDHVLITKDELRSNKTFFDRLFQRFSLVGSNGSNWYVYLWCRSNRNRKAIMTTAAFNPITITREQLDDALNNQVYRDNNEGTCVYQGFIDFFQSKINDNPNDKNAISRYNKLIKQQTLYNKEYNNDDLHTIGELCNTTIHIKNLIDGSVRKFNENNQNKYIITFFQSKINHVDLLLTHKEPEEVPLDEYVKIKERAVWYIEDSGLLTTVNNNNKSYTYKLIKSPFQTASKQWKQQIKYDMMAMNCDNEAMKLLEQVDINQHRFFNKSMVIKNELYEEIDQSKAYANVLEDTNKFYQGLPSGAFMNHRCEDDYTIDTLIEASHDFIGFCNIIITNIKKMNNTLEYLGLTVDSQHTLFSINLIALKDYIDVKFLNVSLAPKINIKFNYEMKNGCEEEIVKELTDTEAYNVLNPIGTIKKKPFYTKMTGMFWRNNDVKTLIVKPRTSDFKYYASLQTDTTQIYKSDDGLIIIKDAVYNPTTHLHWILSIHSYTQLNNLMTILNTNDDTFYHNIIGVKIDSIVLKKDSLQLLNYNKDIYKIKDSNIEWLITDGDDTYEDRIIKPEIRNDFFKTMYNPIPKIIKNTNHFKKSPNGSKQYTHTTTKTYHNIFKFENFKFNNQYITSKCVLCIGWGGAGKTHSTQTFYDLNGLVYVANSWERIGTNLEKNKNTRIKGATTQKMTGKCDQTDTYVVTQDGKSYKKRDMSIIPKRKTKQYGEYKLIDMNKITEIQVAKSAKKIESKNIKTIFIDEATLIKKDIIFDIIEEYYWCNIIIAGDISEDIFYQCSNHKDEDVLKTTDSDIFQITEFTGTYRFDDINLIEKIKILRSEMKRIKTDNTIIFKNKVLFNSFKQLFSDNFYNREDIFMNENDVGISANNENGEHSKHLSKYFISKGAKPRYYIKKTYLENKQTKGTELPDVPDHENYEMTLFKTIHSFQGSELTVNQRIIIDVSSLFDFNLLYTAVSRARRLDQIVILI